MVAVVVVEGSAAVSRAGMVTHRLSFPATRRGIKEPLVCWGLWAAFFYLFLPPPPLPCLYFPPLHCHAHTSLAPPANYPAAVSLLQLHSC